MRVFDTVEAGSPMFGRDGRKETGGWETGAPGLRERGCRDVGVMIKEGSQAEKPKHKSEKIKREQEYPETRTSSTALQEEDGPPPARKEKGIFTGLTIYLNGSTAPTISDHKLKHLLSQHGANISIALGRRSVTHVILGKPNSAKGGSGAGGGLAGSKIQKEISRVGGKGVKFVSVEWVLESIKTGKRQPEARFAVGDNIKPVGVKSVYGMFKKEGTPNSGAEDTESTGGGAKTGSV